MTGTKTADTAVPLHPLLAQRWSPRGFDPTHTLDDGRLQALLEAARWAPSANNSQPWRFLVTQRGQASFDQLSATLATGNRSWAAAASALLLVAAETVDAAGQPRPWALYDTGQAAASLATQAHAEGLHIHQMGGFDTEAVRTRFGLTANLHPVVVIAVGRLDTARQLPEPLAARERAPRSRHPLTALLLPADPARLPAAA
jgi:nitroreductase